MPVLKAEGKTFPTRTQVLIIGAGACGTIAALAANEQGAEVLILERDAKPSGSTSLSGGQIPAAGTKLQKGAGLLDEEARKTVAWLVEPYKLPLSCILDFQYPGHSRPHMHASPSRYGAE